MRDLHNKVTSGCTVTGTDGQDWTGGCHALDKPMAGTTMTCGAGSGCHQNHTDATHGPDHDYDASSGYTQTADTVGSEAGCTASGAGCHDSAATGDAVTTFHNSVKTGCTDERRLPRRSGLQHAVRRIDGELHALPRRRDRLRQQAAVRGRLGRPLRRGDAHGECDGHGREDRDRFRPGDVRHVPQRDLAQRPRRDRRTARHDPPRAPTSPARSATDTQA